MGSLVLIAREGELTAGRALACLIGAAGSAWLYINSAINPTGTSLDRMTWIAPVAILAMMLRS